MRGRAFAHFPVTPTTTYRKISQLGNPCGCGDYPYPPSTGGPEKNNMSCWFLEPTRDEMRGLNTPRGHLVGGTHKAKASHKRLCTRPVLIKMAYELSKAYRISSRHPPRPQHPSMGSCLRLHWGLLAVPFGESIP